MSPGLRPGFAGRARPAYIRSGARARAAPTMLDDDDVPAVAGAVLLYLLLWAMASLVNMHTCFSPRAWTQAPWACVVARLAWDVFALRHGAFFGGLCLWALLETAMVWRLALSPAHGAGVSACVLGAGLCADLVLLAHLAPRG